MASFTANTFNNGEIYIPNYSSSNQKSFSVDEVKEKIYNFHDNSNENDFILSPNKNPQFFKDLCKMLGT